MKKTMMKQKLIGAAMLAVCAVIFLFALRGESLMESDCTPLLVFVPVGLALLLTKQDIFEEWRD
ncbi:MAG: hypothetical protein LUE14_04080 [Clostridiales bacterium]|nr:hypothetical protein [Clostridiales bacterium]